jgi:coenzyme PQQ precursor peptide PqqA
MSRETDWETPSFVEIDMSAEIGSYQSDFEPRPEPSFVDPASKRDHD